VVIIHKSARTRSGPWATQRAVARWRFDTQLLVSPTDVDNHHIAIQEHAPPLERSGATLHHSILFSGHRFGLYSPPEILIIRRFVTKEGRDAFTGKLFFLQEQLDKFVELAAMLLERLLRPLIGRVQ
jgi:hypothetical protein